MSSHTLSPETISIGPAHRFAIDLGEYGDATIRLEEHAYGRWKPTGIALVFTKAQAQELINILLGMYQHEVP